MLNLLLHSENIVEHTTIAEKRYRSYLILGLDRNYHLLLSKAKEEKSCEWKRIPDASNLSNHQP
jgi:hypothetical protein